MSGRRYRIGAAPAWRYSQSKEVLAPIHPSGNSRLRLEREYERAAIEARGPSRPRDAQQSFAFERSPSGDVQDAGGDDGCPPASPSRRLDWRGEITRELLAAAIAMAVPIRIDELRRVPLSRILNPSECARLAAFIGEHGAATQFPTAPGKKHVQFGGVATPDSAGAFARLVDGIARLAHMPGGFTFDGVHFDAPARSA